MRLQTGVAKGGAVACAGVAIVATLARRELPVGAWYAAKSAATLGSVTFVAARQVNAHHPFARFGAANWVTMVRAALTALVAGLVGEPATATVAAAATSLAVIVELLDGADGWLARRSGIASAFGARFDMEIDALLILALAALAWQHGKAGGWVLLSGLLRYAFVGCGWFAPWLERRLPPSRRRQAVCVVQIVVLCAVVSPMVGESWSGPLAAAALGALTGSFLLDIAWLWRARAVLQPGS